MCDGRAVTLTGSGKDEVGLVKGADAFAGGQFTNLWRSFRSAGDNYGVSEQP